MAIDLRAVRDAGHSLYVSAVTARAIELNCTPMNHYLLYQRLQRLPDFIVAPIVMRYLGRVEQAWDLRLDEFIVHMRLSGPDEVSVFIEDILLTCSPVEGVSIHNLFHEPFKQACKTLKRKLATPPTKFEMPEWEELACTHVVVRRMNSNDRKGSAGLDFEAASARYRHVYNPAKPQPVEPPKPTRKSFAYRDTIRHLDIQGR